MNGQPPRTADSARVPPLMAGDRLPRGEFERRYQAMPQVKKAELVEGVVRMPSPVSTERHGAPHAQLVGWLVMYQAHTPGVQVADNATVRLDEVNELQPDALLRVLPSHGGSSRDEEGFVAGGPEWIGEVAGSSSKYDLREKKEAYRRSGVSEYFVWRVDDPEVNWFRMKQGDFVSLPPDQAGVIRSRAFPGLWLDTRALLSGDMRQVFAVLESGLAIDDHGQFVQRLAAASPGA